ncbi:hypothetical protein ABW19_dt0206917 [Dactylella cylindrospora]|nr:hypothetical protein ABW19_dt0206917 [Dactylella cylindrospora]
MSNADDTPGVDEYAEDPNGLGVMAKYKSFNLSPAADAAMELLETIYVLHDEEFGVKDELSSTHKGFITLPKLMGPTLNDLEEVYDEEEAFMQTLVSSDRALCRYFDAMECQYHLVDGFGIQNPFRDFRKPTWPALSRSGFIKYFIIRYIDEMEKGTHRTWELLVRIERTYDLRVPGTNRRPMPLDHRPQCDENFQTLAQELGIPVDKIRRNLNKLMASSTGAKSANEGPLPYAKSEASEATSRVSQTTSSTSQPPPSEYPPKRKKSPRPPSPREHIRRMQSARPPLPPIQPAPAPRPSSYSRGPPRRTLEDIQREKEELEIQKAERELKELEERYEMEAKEREHRNELEYLEMQKRNLEAATRSIERSTEAMRRIGLDEYYPNYYDRY